MTSSQVIGFGLASGGFVLLAFLLIQFVLTISRFWPAPNIGLLHRVALDVSSSGDERPPADPPDVASPLPVAVPPPSKMRWVWLGLLILAILIDIGIEFSLLFVLQADENANIFLFVCGIVLAGMMFAFACRMVLGRSLFIPFKAILPLRCVPPATLWITNLFITLVVCNGQNFDLPNPVNYALLGAWIFNILLFCWNIAQMAQAGWPSREAISTWWQAHKLDILLVSLIGLGALLIRVVGLERYPYAFMNDEGEVGWEALNLIHGSKSNMFETGWAGQSMLSFLPVVFSIKIFGLTAIGVRIISALKGTLAVIGLYLLAREAFGRQVAVFSACLLAALPWHVHFSRLGVMNAGDAFFSSVALWLTYRALRKGTYLDYLLAGLITGCSIYFYVGSRLVVAMVFGVLLYTIIRQRHYFTTHFRHLAVLFFAFLIVAAPGLYAFGRDIDEFMGRSNQEGLLANNRLQQISTEKGITESDFLTSQVQLSTTVFFAGDAEGQFFDSPQPYLPWWAAIFLLLGMFYVFWNITQVRYIMLVGWFWAPVLIGSALTIGPPSHQRMLAAAPALALIVAIGLWKLAQSLQMITRWPKAIFLVLCLLFIGFTNWYGLNYYFVGQYRTEHHFEVTGNEFSYEVGLRAGTLGPNYRLLLIGDPDIYAPFADFHYLTDTDMPIDDFNTVTSANIAALPRDKGIFFAAIPSRVEDLKLVQKQLPGGTWDEVHLHTQDGILYYAYILPPLATTP